MKKLVLLASVSLLTACSLFTKDDKDEPAELVSFEPSIRVDRDWTVNVGGSKRTGIKLTPFSTQTTVYATSDEGDVVSVDKSSGKVNWRIETALPISSGLSVEDGVMVFGTSDGQVVALSSETGAEQWRGNVSSEVLAAPLVHRGIVVARVQDGRVYGFDVNTGQRQWVIDQSIPLLTLRGNSSPIAKGGYAYIGFDNGKVAALRVADGSIVWEKSISNARGRNELERIQDVDGRIALLASDVYASSYNGSVSSLTSDSGRVLWTRELSSASGLTVERSLLFLSDTDDAVWALERISGGTLWKQDRLANRGISAPVVIGDYAIVADRYGFIHWLDSDNGNFAARVKLGDDQLAGDLISTGNQLITYSKSGKLSAYRIKS